MTALKPGTVVAKQGGQSFEAEALYAEPAFFQMFSFPLVHGSPAEALRQPNGVVLTTEQARASSGAPTCWARRSSSASTNRSSRSP